MVIFAWEEFQRMPFTGEMIASQKSFAVKSIISMESINFPVHLRTPVTYRIQITSSRNGTSFITSNGLMLPLRLMWYEV